MVVAPRNGTSTGATGPATSAAWLSCCSCKSKDGRRLGGNLLIATHAALDAKTRDRLVERLEAALATQARQPKHLRLNCSGLRRVT